MNIAVCGVQVPFVRGGAEVMIDNFMNALQSRKYNTELVQIPFKWYPKEQIIKDCMAWRLLDITESYFKKIDLVIATKFPSYLIRHPNKKVWLIHQFREVYDCYGTNLSSFTNSKNDSELRQAIFTWDHEALSEAKQLFTISKNVSKRLLHYNGLESKHLYVPPKLIGNYLQPDYEDFILCPGRLEIGKRVHLLLEAMSFIPEKIKCVIAGTGPQSGNLKEIAEKLGISSRVTFLGYVSDDDLLKLYSKAFAVFFSPYDEDLGLVTLEAFHAKKPVITCDDAGAVLEFVKHDISGFISEANGVSIADYIVKLYDNRYKCRAMGEAGYNFISYITWDYVMQNLLGTQ